MSLTGLAPSKTDLQRLTLRLGAALLFFALLLLAVVVYAGWSTNKDAVKRERQLVENALDQAVSRVLNEEKAIAWWDDAVVGVQARPLDLDFIETNIGVYFYETYGHDEIYIVDGQNRPIYANIDGELQAGAAAAFAGRADVLDLVVQAARGEQSDQLRARDGAFRADQARYSSLLGAQSAGWGAHILTIDGVPSVVSAMAIVPSVDPSVLVGAPHLMVSVVRMDEDFLRGVGNTLLMPDLSISAAPFAAKGMTSQAFQADDGEPVGYLHWTPRQPGQSLLFFILPLVALGAIGVGALAGVMIARLKRASSDLVDREHHARHQALHDALSGLPNRVNFQERLQEGLDELVQSRVNGRVVVAYVDVDRFKDINDTMGHEAGDMLIMAVANRLANAIGPGDFLARFGGDEFAVLRRSPEPDAAAELAARLMRGFEQGFEVFGQCMRLTASIGVSSAPQHGDSPQDLMRNADIALYRAKAKGRDRAVFFNADMSAELERRREIEVDLQAAIDNGDLALHYQPIVVASDQRIGGVEALLRWRHPVRGDIPPGMFVPIAEESGLMPALGAFVIERAFEDSKAWPELEVSINLSPVQFRHVDLAPLLERLLAKHQIDPARIILEVTEGVLMESTDRNRRALEDIRALGFQIALDDFGTGYSSLSYLCDFRFDKIKIDRSFVAGVEERKRAMTVVQSVIALGRGLGMEIVAEGVETEAEASIMRLMGVTELQGFYFSRPAPAEAIAGLARRFAEEASATETALPQKSRVRAIS
jgi:diguanylate cyclase (GGDEF)-like protein